MRQSVGRFIVAIVVGLMLLGSAGRALAGPAASSCCICSGCISGASTCAAIASEIECTSFCLSILPPLTNATACTSEVVNASCAGLAECRLAGAPMLGTSGLTLVTVLLSVFGIVGLRRAARRQRS